GMKLRAFLIGPFQWHIREGKWEFQFKPKDILTVGGATAVVPATADFPRWSYLCMIAAGPCATLLTGIFALWIAFAAKGDSLLPATGPLALFGAWSLVVCAFNLLPLRTHGYYCDGAQFYQLLSHGPWGDFHRVVAAVGSTQVSPLRPMNYDIQAILRAAQRITLGRRGLLPRLYAYFFFPRSREDCRGWGIVERGRIDLFWVNVEQPGGYTSGGDVGHPPDIVRAYFRTKILYRVVSNSFLYSSHRCFTPVMTA